MNYVAAIHGNWFDSYFYKDNEKFTINPVSVVLPLNNGEIHEFGKTEINFASFCD